MKIRDFLNNLNTPIKIGNGVDYTEFEVDGTQVMRGDATIYDDLRVSPMSAPNIGVNTPIPEIVANDGSATVGSAFSFNGTSSNGVVPYYSAMNTQNLTISLWVKPDTIDSNELLDRNGTGGFECYLNGSDIIFAIDGGNAISTNANAIIVGSLNHVVVTVKYLTATTSRVKIYINGQNLADTVVNSVLNTTATDGYIIGEWNNGGWSLDGVLDNIQTYNIILTDAQITELYNGGQGTNTLPTGVTETTDLIMYFQDSYVNTATLNALSVTDTFTSVFDTAVSLPTVTTANSHILVIPTPIVKSSDGLTTYTDGTDYTIDYTDGTITVLSTGTMLDATSYTATYDYYAHNMTATDITLVDGLIGITSGSIGVILDAYYPDTVMSKFFTMQMPHGKKLRDIANSVAGTIFTHPHFYSEDLSAGDIVWKLEFIWNQHGLSIPNTSIVELVIANDTIGDPDNSNKPIQVSTNLPSTGITPPMDNESVSSTLICRLYRDGTDARDTYTGKVYLHEFDAHIEYDMQGSRGVITK